MVENHFRHLPVCDDQGAVVGVLDIGKCLNDAISKLERVGETKGGGDNVALDAVKQVAALQTPGNANATAALQALLGKLMSQAVGGEALPTLQKILRGKPSTIVGPNSSIRETAKLMAESRHAALIVDNGRLVGIFGFKDMMTRVIAGELPVDTTGVVEVMTPEPESISPNATVLDALQLMYDHKFLTLPVVNEITGDVIGVVDVMDVIYGCGGTAGWRSIFSSAMELDNLSENDESASRASRNSLRRESSPGINTPYRDLNIPATLEFEEGVADNHSFAGSTIDQSGRWDGPVFKVTDPSGKTHRIKCDLSISSLLDAVAAKVTSIPRKALQLQFVDDEGDVVTMTSDDDVIEALTLSKKSGSIATKLAAVAIESKSIDQTMIAVGGAAAVAALGLLAATMLRSKK